METQQVATPQQQFKWETFKIIICELANKYKRFLPMVLTDATAVDDRMEYYLDKDIDTYGDDDFICVLYLLEKQKPEELSSAFNTARLTLSVALQFHAVQLLKQLENLIINGKQN